MGLKETVIQQNLKLLNSTSEEVTELMTAMEAVYGKSPFGPAHPSPALLMRAGLGGASEATCVSLGMHASECFRCLALAAEVSMTLAKIADARKNLAEQGLSLSLVALWRSRMGNPVSN